MTNPRVPLNSIFLPTKPIADITGILLLSSPGIPLLIQFLFFLVILALGTPPFPFCPISGFVKMGLYLLGLGLPTNFTSFSQKIFQVILFVLEAPLTWLRSVLQTKEFKQWAVGLLRLGVPMYVRTL